MAQLLRHRGEKLGRDRQVKEPVSLRGMRFFRGHDLRAQFFVRRRVLEVSLHVVDSLEKPIPEVVIQRVGRKLSDILAELLPERFRGKRIVGETDHRELR